MLDFQKQNNIGFIQEEGNSAAAYLVRLNQQYASLKTEYELLEKLRSRPESRSRAGDKARARSLSRFRQLDVAAGHAVF